MNFHQIFKRSLILLFSFSAYTSATYNAYDPYIVKLNNLSADYTKTGWASYLLYSEKELEQQALQEAIEIIEDIVSKTRLTDLYTSDIKRIKEQITPPSFGAKVLNALRFWKKATPAKADFVEQRLEIKKLAQNVSQHLSNNPHPLSAQVQTLQEKLPQQEQSLKELLNKAKQHPSLAEEKILKKCKEFKNALQAPERLTDVFLKQFNCINAEETFEKMSEQRQKLFATIQGIDNAITELEPKRTISKETKKAFKSLQKTRKNLTEHLKPNADLDEFAKSATDEIVTNTRRTFQSAEEQLLNQKGRFINEADELKISNCPELKKLLDKIKSLKENPNTFSSVTETLKLRDLLKKFKRAQKYPLANDATILETIDSQDQKTKKEFLKTLNTRAMLFLETLEAENLSQTDKTSGKLPHQKEDLKTLIMHYQKEGPKYSAKEPLCELFGTNYLAIENFIKEFHAILHAAEIVFDPDIINAPNSTEVQQNALIKIFSNPHYPGYNKICPDASETNSHVMFKIRDISIPASNNFPGKFTTEQNTTYPSLGQNTTQILATLREAVFIRNFFSQNQTYIIGYILLSYYNDCEERWGAPMAQKAADIITETLKAYPQLFPNAEQIIPSFLKLSKQSRRAIEQSLEKAFDAQQLRKISIYIVNLESGFSHTKQDYEVFLNLFSGKKITEAPNTSTITSALKTVVSSGKITSAIANSMKLLLAQKKQLTWGWQYRAWLLDNTPTIYAIFRGVAAGVYQVGSDIVNSVSEIRGLEKSTNENDSGIVKNLEQYIFGPILSASQSTYTSLLGGRKEDGSPIPLEINLKTLVLDKLPKNTKESGPVLQKFEELLKQQIQELHTFQSWENAKIELNLLYTDDAAPIEKITHTIDNRLCNFLKKENYVTSYFMQQITNIKAETSNLQTPASNPAEARAIRRKLYTKIAKLEHELNAHITWDASKKAACHQVFMDFLAWQKKRTLLEQSTWLQDPQAQKQLATLAKSSQHPESSDFITLAQSLSFDTCAELKNAILDESVTIPTHGIKNQNTQPSFFQRHKNKIFYTSAAIALGGIAYFGYQKYLSQGRLATLPNTAVPLMAKLSYNAPTKATA